MCTHATRACLLTLIYTHTQTRAAPEQNSIINGLIARVELLWESEPATLNKIKPLLYIFIIPNRVLNCKCVSETQHCPSFLPSLSFPLFFPPFSLLSHYGNPLLLLVPFLTSYMYLCSCAHTHARTFLCCGMYVWPPLSSLIKGKGCVCLWEREELCAWGSASGPRQSSFAYLQSGQTDSTATYTTVTSL